MSPTPAPSRFGWAAVGLAVAALCISACLLAGPPDGLLDTDAWARRADALLAWRQQSPMLFLAGFMAVFVLLSALALPGCAALSLLAGSAWGTLGGTLLVGLASTLGALLPFLAARHWARTAVQRRLGHRLADLDRRLARHGALGLVGLRLLPVLPYPLLNPLLGLTGLSVPAFFWPSLAGLTLGSLPYVWAGQSIAGLLRAQPGLHGLALAAAVVLLAGAALLARHRRARGTP